MILWTGSAVSAWRQEEHLQRHLVAIYFVGSVSTSGAPPRYNLIYLIEIIHRQLAMFPFMMGFWSSPLQMEQKLETQYTASDGIVYLACWLISLMFVQELSAWELLMKISCFASFFNTRRLIGLCGKGIKKNAEVLKCKHTYLKTYIYIGRTFFYSYQNAFYSIHIFAI